LHSHPKILAKSNPLSQCPNSTNEKICKECVIKHCNDNSGNKILTCNCGAQGLILPNGHLQNTKKHWNSRQCHSITAKRMILFLPFQKRCQCHNPNKILLSFPVLA
ncbi:hypothetical protein VP01_10748g1, partial [Puccinia sorghi]